MPRDCNDFCRTCLSAAVREAAAHLHPSICKLGMQWFRKHYQVHGASQALHVVPLFEQFCLGESPCCACTLGSHAIGLPFYDLNHMQGAAMEQHLAAALQAGSAWAADMRAGLGLVLRSHSAWQQRHAALQLAEAVAALAGTSWLLDAQTVHYCSAGPASMCVALM